MAEIIDELTVRFHMKRATAHFASYLTGQLGHVVSPTWLRAATDRARLMEEIVRAGELVRAEGAATGRPVDKLNVAALGNVTAQLHVHVVGRRRDDGLWPDPVWGRGGARPCDAAARAAVVARLTA